MKLNNGNNIITDSDITMTGNLIGHSLSTVINKQELDIQDLKSNVKWIYKYGGVGSGGHGGGGGENVSKPWNFKVEIDEVVRDKGSIINLGKLGIYKLNIQLYKVQGRTFLLKITYPTENGSKIINKILPPDNKPVIEEYIDLQVNGDLTIVIEDDEGNFDQFILSYIVTAYQFNLSYVRGDLKHSLFTPKNNNIFISEVKDLGLFADFHYIISTEIESAYYVYTDWNNVKSELIPLKKGLGHAYIPLGKELLEENAGNYNFIVEVHLVLANNIEEEVIPNLRLSDNLIPNKIYLKVETEGIIYNKSGIIDPYKFYTGVIVFKVTPFQGGLDLSNNYSLSVEINGEFKETVLLRDLTTYPVSVLTDLIGENRVKFTYERNGQVGNSEYIFYTQDALGSFNWYPSQSLNLGETKTAYPSLSYQYLYAKSIFKHNNVHLIPGTSLNNLIARTILDKPLTLITSFKEEHQKLDCLIAIGFLYNYLNDVTKPICTIRGRDIANDIIVYLNLICVADLSLKVYLPKDENYHLLSIYRRAVSVLNGLPIFELNFYIDGVLEKSSATFITILELYLNIILYEGLYNINYLELSYFPHTPNIKDFQIPFLQYNLNPNKYYIDYLNDSGILFHYYSYKLTCYPESISDDFKEVYTHASKFYTNYLTNRVEVTELAMLGVATNINIPVLMLEYTENRDAGDPNWYSNGEAIFDWMEKGYDVTSDTGILDIQYTVNVYWSKGKLELKLVDISKLENTNFKLSLQGTSTLLYTNKNFDLAIDSIDEENTYLYSPNFNPNNTSTFLPETRFTLKADIVDSSHSNNNALGKFINTVTTPFQDAQQSTSLYSPFIKNTLEGFPVLLFFKNRYYINNITPLPEEDIYYLGIYNFNLGRDSEYNLGYKDLRLLPDKIDLDFSVIKIPNDKKISPLLTLSTKSYLDKLGVAEIRENRNYFDFSQSDTSVLFPVSKLDNDYMFGKTKSNSLPVLQSALSKMVKGVSRAGGYIFDTLGKNMLEDGGYEYGYKSPLPLNLVPNYKIHFKRTIIDSKSVLTKIGNVSPGISSDLASVLLGNGIEGEPDYQAPVVDYRAVSEYYVCCMALGLVDSVMKNLNVKTWNGITFYPSFYDMDTALGKDNAGKDTSYTAFSDYWEPADRKDGGKFYLEPAISYKDWYKAEVLGFDIPMTYLFALAKYGYHVALELSLEDWYPNNIWARFRRKNTNINQWTPPGGFVKAHVGCLETSDKFIENFFLRHLGSIPDVMFNLNYRKKYFILNNGANSVGYREEDYSKFSGRRIYSVRDWLKGRFHILDLYFNLASVSDSIKKYDLIKLEWQTIPNVSYTNPSPKFIDVSNDDIIVLQNIFTPNNGVAPKYSTNIDIDITAEDYSPLSFSGSALKLRYIIKDSLKLYSLHLDSNGKSLNLGGSKNWTTINKIDTLIQQGDTGASDSILYINSDKLTNLNGYSGNCGNWQLTMPALLDITLISNGYTGQLSFEGKNLWPNLKNINISGSKLGVNLNNVNAVELIANNVKSKSDLNIINCPRLRNISYENSRFNTINLTLHQDTVFFSKHTFLQKSPYLWAETSIDAKSPKCKRLDIINTYPGGGVIFIDNLEYYINNVLEGLLKVTLRGFKEIHIRGCQFLEDVVINSSELVEYISITLSGGISQNLKINSENLKEINLSQFTKLKKITFNNTLGFSLVLLPNNVELEPDAFAYTLIRYLKGTNIKLASGAFCNSRYTLLSEPNGTITNFNNAGLATPGNASLLFHGTAISLDAFNTFNSIYSPLIRTITNATNMWAYIDSLAYNEDILLEDILRGVCRINLSMYTNVTNATQMLGGTNKSACHPDILKGLGSTSGVNLHNFYGWSLQAGKVITVPIDWLKHVGTKVTDFNLDSTLIIFKIVDSNSVNQKTTFKILELFPVNNKINEFKNWIFEENHILDLSEHPFNNYLNLQTINKSFCGCKGINLINAHEGFLYHIPSKLKNILGSFGFTNYASLNVELNALVNWDNLKSNGLFLYVDTWDEKYHVGEYNKTLPNITMFNSIYKTLLKTTTSSNLAHVFRNCTIRELPGVSITLKLDIPNTIITHIPYLFDNLKIVSNTGEPVLVNWDWNMMESLPNIKYLRRTFRNNRFNNKIPFNFFKTRSRTSGRLVFIEKEEGIFEPGTLYEYSYKNNIENMEECFMGCHFSEKACTFTYSPLDFTGINDESYVLYTPLEGEPIKYYKYRNKDSVFAEEILILNPERDDLNFEVDYIKDIENIIKNKDTNVFEKYENFSPINPNCLNNPFISPDFFYSCKSNAKLNACFADCGLQGYIPDNLLSKCSSADINNFIRNVLIFPKKYGHYPKVLEFPENQYRYMNGNDRVFISYYIGSNFTTSLNLDNAFNFRIALPNIVSQLLDSGEYSLHVFCFKDSFSKNISSAKNIFPYRIQAPKDGTYFAILNNKNANFINMMYDQSTLVPTEHEINLGNVSELDPLKVKIGNLGFDLTYYNRLYTDQLVNSTISLFTYDNFFDSKTLLNSLKKLITSDNNWIMLFGNAATSDFNINGEIFKGLEGRQFGISYNAKLPGATSSNTKSLYIYSISRDGDTSQTYPDGINQSIAKWLISSGYNNNIQLYYNNSIVVHNSWKITFK